MLPIPSTVVTARPCIEHTGARHAFSAMCLERQVKDDKSYRDSNQFKGSGRDVGAERW